MKDLCLIILAACFLTVTTGCRQYADGEVQDLMLCVGEDFEPIDECAEALCSAQRILHKLQQEKEAGEEIAEAERAVEELSGSYEQCCVEDDGDMDLGFTTKPRTINMAVSGSANDPIGGISEPLNPVSAKVALHGCYHSRVSFGIEAVELYFYGFDVIIYNIDANGTFVATSDATDVGSMTILFEVEVAVNLDELGLASDILSFTLTTDALGGARFMLDETSGEAFGRLALSEPIKASPGGAFEEYGLDLDLVMTIEGLEDPFL